MRSEKGDRKAPTVPCGCIDYPLLSSASPPQRAGHNRETTAFCRTLDSPPAARPNLGSTQSMAAPSTGAHSSCPA
ncbi:hypothetical protein [Opitutus sp. ER46]|uniref:hypothetical protein n=1 Tax=Opitutus sp. ER46 TaxID=2161864 RepID=UPI0011B1EF84|nr:hypothetical protein [Opitutus sp. ER46]